jgi:hypothetical protein
MMRSQAKEARKGDPRLRARAQRALIARGRRDRQRNPWRRIITERMLYHAQALDRRTGIGRRKNVRALRRSLEGEFDDERRGMMPDGH